MYSGAGIPHYWIANRIDQRIEAFSEPTDGDYAVRRDHAAADEIPLIVDECEIAGIAVAQLLP